MPHSTHTRQRLGDQRLIGRVYAFVAYRVGAGADAEDITSLTFERALRYSDSFDPRQGDLVGWLIGIARRCIADRTLGNEEISGQPAEIADEGHEALALRRVELAAALGALADRDREIIALRFGADMTVRGIAQLLDLRTNSVEVALHRALARLREELGDADASAPRGYAAPAPNGF